MNDVSPAVYSTNGSREAGADNAGLVLLLAFPSRRDLGLTERGGYDCLSRRSRCGARSLYASADGAGHAGCRIRRKEKPGASGAAASAQIPKPGAR